MEAAYATEMLVTFSKTALRYIPEDRNRQIHSRENPSSNIW
jgi:hypothetical protein